MKYLLALFVLSLTLQPFELQACDMGDAQAPSHHAALHDSVDRDCCNPGGNAPTKDCDDASHCAFLAIGFLVIPPASGPTLTTTEHLYELPDGATCPHGYSKPLLRPPSA